MIPIRRKTVIYIVLGTLAVILIAVIIAAKSTKTNKSGIPWIFEAPEKRAGRRGEYAATNAIKSVLREGDYLFTNVSISYDGKPAELDNVVVNSYGVFIIEVKNYKGRLYGEEDDYEWLKFKDDGYGNTFSKTVKNPIKQVKRQVYLLAKYIDFYASRVWVEGYALLVRGNSPIDSPYLLESIADIDRAIHTPGRNRLSSQQIESIRKLLDDEKQDAR